MTRRAPQNVKRYPQHVAPPVSDPDETETLDLNSEGVVEVQSETQDAVDADSSDEILRKRRNRIDLTCPVCGFSFSASEWDIETSDFIFCSNGHAIELKEEGG